jgi:LysR family transcriptional activator of nhaA
MTPLNYNHLYYFFHVATDGSITRASKRLNLTPQTISGQIAAFEEQLGVKLFRREGRRLRLSEQGRQIYAHADEIFQLGREIRQLLQTESASAETFRVGITDSIPKILANRLLQPALKAVDKLRLQCHEGDQETLLAELAVSRLDCIITDQPLPSGSHIKAWNYRILESGFTFFAVPELAAACREHFPASLSGKPFLAPGRKAGSRSFLKAWFEKHGITPEIVAEFDDSALLKSFGQTGLGVFASPTIIEEYVTSQYGVAVIGRTREFVDVFYAISPERRLQHPATLEIVNTPLALESSASAPTPG